MPRFQEEHVAMLVRTMLPRVPECVFTQEDVQQIERETGLNKAQVLEWAHNLRNRVPDNQRSEYLRTIFDEKEADDTKSSRFYITGFNIDVDFVKNIVISKANSTGKFNINYMCAALNKEAYAGEIFIEIDGTIRVRTLMAQLEEMGACQVSILTFKHNDGNESASNALLRVWTAAEKTGQEYTCGIPSKDLWGKAKTKQDAEKQQKTDFEKNEAKLNEGVRQSLAAMGEKVANVGGKVEHIDKKVDTMEVKIESVQQGVCTIIPDYQKLLKDTMEKLAHKTKEVDRIEYRMGLMTREINKRDELIAGLTTDNEQLSVKTKQYEREIEHYKALETAKWIIETERDIKRARM